MNRSTAIIAGLLLALVLLSSFTFYEYAQNASLSAANSKLQSEINSPSFSNVVTIASNVTVMLSPCHSSCTSSKNNTIASFTAEHPGFVLVTATYSLLNTTILEPLIIGATGSFDCSKFITQQLYSLYPCNGGFPVYFGPAPVVIPVLPGKITIIAFNFGNATVSSSFSVKYYSW